MNNMWHYIYNHVCNVESSWCIFMHWKWTKHVDPTRSIPWLLTSSRPKAPVASLTKEVDPRLAKRPLIFNGRLANRGFTSLVNEATGRQQPQYWQVLFEWSGFRARRSDIYMSDQTGWHSYILRSQRYFISEWFIFRFKMYAWPPLFTGVYITNWHYLNHYRDYYINAVICN